jgi:hypothetical protein
VTKRTFVVLLLMPFYLFALGFFAHLVWAFISFGWQVGDPPR